MRNLTATWLAVTVAVLAPVACKKSSVAAPAPSDASVAMPDARATGATGARAAYTGPLEPHLVARSTSLMTRLVDLPGGKIVLDAGVFVYELTPDGLATRLGDVASYATHFHDEDDQIGGYDVKPSFHVMFNDRIRGQSGGLVVIDEPPHRWTWTGTAWKKEASPDAGDLDGGGALDIHVIDLPPGIDDGKLVRTADGTVIVIAREAASKTPITVVAARGSRAGRLVRIGDLAAGPDTSVSCDHVGSWSTPHVACRTDWGAEAMTTLHRLAGDRWERVRLDDATMKGISATAVGYDGALWIGSHEGRLAHITTSGVVDTYLMPKADASIARASYSTSEELGRTAKTEGGEDGARPWQRVTIEPKADPEPVGRIRQIVPRPDGEAWVLAHEGNGGRDGSARVVVHMSRPPIASLPDVVVVGTDTDQRNEVRNTRPAKSWVGHCPQLFVAIAKQRTDGSFAPEPVWAGEKRFSAVLKKAWGSPTAATPQAALVEGWLGGRRVAGVLVWRASASAREDLLEKSMNAIVEDVSSSTGAPPPDITCTVPVLERASRL